MAPQGNRLLRCARKCYDFGEIFQNVHIFANFTAAQKIGHIDFPEKRAPTKVKHLLSVCQVSLNFTKGNAGKFTVNFAFCAHVDVI